MKLVTVSTALYWLLDHLRRTERQSEPERFAWERERRTSSPVFIPVVYEPPTPCTKPLMQSPHGRYFLQERHRYSPISQEPTEPLAPPPKWVLPAWLNDLPIDVAPSALDQLSQLAETQHDLKAVRKRHEGRGKAN